MRGSVGAIALLTIVGCASPGAVGVFGPLSVLGEWGGSEASLVLTSTGGSVNYWCGTGTIDASWSLNADGLFIAAGQHNFGKGRPPHPARYVGQVESDELVLTVTLADVGQVLGPYHLVRNGPVVEEQCD